MIGIVIVTHGNLGEELLSSAEIICGKQEHVITVGLHPSDAIVDLPGRIDAARRSFPDCSDALVLVDLFGGSPCNSTMRCLAAEPFQCISGVNLPMLLEVLTQREDTPLQQLIGQAIEAGRNGIRDLSAAFFACQPAIATSVPEQNSSVQKE